MSAPGTSIVVAGSRPWNRATFERWPRRSEAHFIGSRPELRADLLARLEPRFVFFVHWSWRIPAEIYDTYECIGFHMTDLPFGRGGSPLQNLIERGIRETQLSAFRVGAEMDAGDIYLKRPLSLDGRAQAIFERASDLAFEMIDQIVDTRPVPVPQVGEVVAFERRTPAQSRVPELPTEAALYDFIRMLDADGYPRAFIEASGFRFELSDAELDHNGLRATVRMRRLDGGS